MTSLRPARLLLAAVLVCAVGGCDMTTTSRDRTERVQEIERSNHASFDLTSPLTPELAGIAEGRDSVMIGHTGGSPRITTLLRLPGDTTLEVPASGIAIRIGGRPAGSAQGDQIVVNEPVASVAVARERLLDVAPSLGLDPGLIEEWATKATAIEGSDELDAVAAQFIAGTPRDYLTIGVEARFNPPTTPPVLNWQFDWK